MSRTCARPGCENPLEGKRKDARFCTAECRIDARNASMRKPKGRVACANPECGREFEQDRSTDKYCKRRCADRAMSIRKRHAGAHRLRGYADWNPGPESEALLDDIRGVIDQYRDHLPLTIRQVFYVLVGRGAEKTDSFYNRVQKALGRGRRARLLDFDHFRDDTATSEPGYGKREGNTSPAGYMAGLHRELRTLLATNYYRRGRHEDQPYYIDVWCEAAGMVPQVQRAVAELGVTVWSGGGYDSITSKKAYADQVGDRDEPTVLLHIGDLDDDGQAIYDALTEDIAAFTPGDFEPVRVAVTERQVEDLELPTFEGKVQAEAIPPDVLAEIVGDAVLDWYDEDAAAEVQKREADERAEVDRLLAELREQVQLPGEAE